MSNVGKPPSLSDMLCPFFKEPMKSVCHRCEFWEAIQINVVQLNKTHDTVDHWGCTIKHQTFVMRDMVARLDGVQKAQETFNSEAWKETQHSLDALIALAGKFEGVRLTGPEGMKAIESARHNKHIG